MIRLPVPAAQRVLPRLLLTLVMLALAGCGGFPQPLAGHPGRMGARLVLPPPPRLLVPAPPEALLPASDGAIFANALARALAARDVPATVEPGRGADWRLAITAELQPQGQARPQVIVTYTVLNPNKVAQGSVTGASVSAETWSKSSPVALDLVARRDAPAIATLLERIQAALQLSDPNSLVNRPPRLALSGVTGAPGDGNQALAKDLVAALTALGLIVQDTPQGADFEVRGQVSLSQASAAQDHVEIQWTVLDRYGRGAGQLTQIHDIAHGTLDRFWGDVALAASQEAAGGVREVIVNQTASGRIGTGKPPPAAGAAPGTAVGTASGTAAPRALSPEP